jgi:NAD(P)H-hydrate epimerase
MARLIGAPVEKVTAEPLDVARRCASEHECIVVLKGAPTIVASPGGEIWINPSGTPALATGGSGDVLTGIIASLLGQGLAPLDAARLGAFVHGWTGERIAAEHGVLGLAPPDLIGRLPETLRALRLNLPYGPANPWVMGRSFLVHDP